MKKAIAAEEKRENIYVLPDGYLFVKLTDWEHADRIADWMYDAKGVTVHNINVLESAIAIGLMALEKHVKRQIRANKVRKQRRKKKL